MKLTELYLTEDVFITDNDEILTWLVKNANDSLGNKLDTTNIKIENGIVNITGSKGIKLKRYAGVKVQFGDIEGDFIARNTASTFKGSPKKAHAFSYCNNPTLKSFEGLNVDCWEFRLDGTGITSLKDIHKHVRCERFGIPEKITSGLLDVLRIQGLEDLWHFGKNPELLKAFKIIEKYHGKGKSGIIDAQAELIDEDLDSFC